MQAGLNFLDTDFTKVVYQQIKPNAFFYGADINNGRLFSKMDNTGTLTVIESVPGSALAAIISITYAALRAAMTGATLVPGQMYVITDFTTIYDQPDYDVAGVPKVAVVTKTAAVEPLVITATSTNTIASEVFSRLFPFDQIQYNVLFDTTEYMAAPAKGRISQRIDVDGNTTDYDHRKVLFLRYESAPASGIFNVVNDNGGATDEQLTFGTGCVGNLIGNFAEFLVYGFPFLLSNNRIGINSFSNIFEQGVYNNTIGSANLGNFLSSGNYNNVIGNSSFSNILSNNVVNTTLGNVATRNFIKDGSTITMGDTCGQNTIGYNNVGTLGANNNNNTFGNDNTITLFGSGNTNNVFGDNNTFTDFGDSNANNVFGDINTFTLFGDSNVGNTFGKSNTFTNFGNSNTNNVFGNNNTLTVVGNTNVRNTFKHFNLVSIGASCANNSFGISNTIVLGNTCEGNTFGNSNDITLGATNKNNCFVNYGTYLFGANCEQNNGYDYNNITMGTANTNNSFGSTNTIVIGNDCNSNAFGELSTLTIPNDSVYNIFGSFIQNATFNNPLLCNNFASRSIAAATDFTAATHIYLDYDCSIVRSANFTKILIYTSAINVVTVVAANA